MELASPALFAWLSASWCDLVVTGNEMKRFAAIEYNVIMREPLLDHLVYATPDLEATCRDLESRLGVRASAGGQHAGRGTHNALISIGPKAYLEIIGPDPLQPETKPVWFDIDQLTAPKLIAWAVRIDDLEAFVKEISPNANVGVVRSGSRKTPEGTTLSWQLTELVQGVGLIPF